jgi:hypothetical protein
MLEAEYGPNPVHQVSGRFDGYAVHRKCYHCSSTTADELRQEIASKTWDGSPNELVDLFGMTPFHVLLSSVGPSSDLLAVLCDEYPGYALGWKDKLGNRAVDYLIGNWAAATSSSRALIQCALRKWTMDRLSSWNRECAMVQMSSQLDQIHTEDDMESRDRLLWDLFVVMEGHERVEAIAVLELGLWKVGISSLLAATGADDCEQLPIDRESCRAKCGASFVVPNVIDFLGLGRIATTTE